MQVSQPSLSDGIRRLEAELDVRLFHRLGRSVELTDAGRAFVGPARQLTRDRDAVLESVAGVRGLRRGHARLRRRSRRWPPIRSAGWSGGFRKAHPGIVVRIAAPDDVGAVDAMVLDGRCELGLTELPPRRDELVAVVARAPGDRRGVPAPHPAPGARAAAGGAAARTCRWSRPRAGSSTRDLLDRALAAAGVEPVIAVETSQREAIAPLVLARRGHVVPAGRPRRSRSPPRARSSPGSCPR